MKLHNHVTVRETKELYIFKDNYYSKMFDSDIDNFVRSTFKPKIEDGRQIRNFTTLVKSENVVSKNFLDNGLGGHVNLRNGILRISDRTLLPHDPKYGMQSIQDYDFDAEAKCPTWDQLMKNVTRGRYHLQEVIEEYLGYCLSGSEYIMHNFLILAGDGGNGKSSVIESFISVIGSNNCHSLEIANLGRNKFQISELNGKLANFSEEEPENVFSESGIIKKLTGNTPVPAEVKFGGTYSFCNRAKMVMSYNVMPVLHDTSEGMRRRMLIVPFDVRIKDDPSLIIRDLSQKIKAERSGILNRALTAYERTLARGGFVQTDECHALFRDIVRNSNSIEEWLEDCVEITLAGEDFLKSKDLYDAYRNDFPTESISIDSFSKRTRPFLSRNQLKKIVKKVDGFPHRGIVGIRINRDKNKVLSFPEKF
jgi:putative DNA primase/helicase